MILVWRGWGILTPLISVALVIPAILIGMEMSNITTGVGYAGALGFALAAVANWFVGRHFNINRPAAKLTAYVTERRAALQAAVQSGQFSLGPGHTPPASLDEAQRQADFLLDQETRELQARPSNTFFWIPMQWWSIGSLICAVLFFMIAVTS